MTEKQLILALHQNQPKAFDLVFEDLFPELCYYAGKFVNDKETAKDLASESLGKFWRKEKTEFNTIEGVRQFLYGITRNACIDFLRKTHTRLNHLAELSKLAEDENALDYAWLETDIIKEIFQEIERLPAKCKEVFKLSYIEGLKRSEVANLMKISENTVRNHNIKALQILRLAFAHRDLIVAYLLLLELQEIGFQIFTDCN